MIERISINKYVCHGKPCIKGTRIMAWQILDLLAGGCTIDEIISDYFPGITKEDIQACINFTNAKIQKIDNSTVKGIIFEASNSR